MCRMTILVDADDVVENLCDCWVALLNKRYGTNVTSKYITSWDVSLAFPALNREQVFGVLAEDDLWDMIEPVPGAQETLQRLYNDGHEIYIVSASDYRSCSAKFGRILSFFPWLKWDHVIIASNKQMIKGDVLIDDNPCNLVGGGYQKLLFDRPHNRCFDEFENGIIRVRTWDEVYSIIQNLRRGL